MKPAVASCVWVPRIQRTQMLFRVYLEKELFMEKVRVVKANSEGAALKDDSGVTRVLDGVYVAEVEGVAGFITLRHVQPAARGP